MKLKYSVASLLRRWANKLSGDSLAPDNTIDVSSALTMRTLQRLMVEQTVVIPRNPQEFPSDYLTECVPKDLALKISDELLQNLSQSKNNMSQNATGLKSVLRLKF